MTHTPSHWETMIVGQPYPQPEVISEPSAGWHPATGQLLISDHHMSHSRAVAEWTDARVWLVPSGPLLVLVAQLANRDELEMPATWIDTEPRPGWVSLDLHGSQRLPLTIVSVDCDTTIVHRLHTVTMSPHFSQTLVTQARRRWENPITGADMATAVAAYQQRYPQIKNALRASVASTRLGEP